MNLCNDKHEEVCYDGRICPVCDMRDDKDSDITQLEARLINAEEKLTEAKHRIEELENELKEAGENE